MPKKNKKFSHDQIRKRTDIEEQLRLIPPFSDCVKKIISLDGFIDYYESMKYLYPTFVDAYERLEQYHVIITGRRKYSDWNAFMVMVRRLEMR